MTVPSSLPTRSHNRWHANHQPTAKQARPIIDWGVHIKQTGTCGSVSFVGSILVKPARVHIPSCRPTASICTVSRQCQCLRSCSVRMVAATFRHKYRQCSWHSTCAFKDFWADVFHCAHYWLSRVSGACLLWVCVCCMSAVVQSLHAATIESCMSATVWSFQLWDCLIADTFCWGLCWHRVLCYTAWPSKSRMRLHGLSSVPAAP